uniref:Uncharacterized protein n=1 Tax=Cacopsylla melanoneura TaxID=428564 RepID=A0A8D8RC14_9HEMI
MDTRREEARTEATRPRLLRPDRIIMHREAAMGLRAVATRPPMAPEQVEVIRRRAKVPPHSRHPLPIRTLPVTAREARTGRRRDMERRKEVTEPRKGVTVKEDMGPRRRQIRTDRGPHRRPLGPR